jgi:7-keto-8-aminopelargonate synthetase-like enzyme
VHEEELRCGGSMDATLVDDSIFELKTVIWNKFNRIVMVANWPEYEHLLQTAGYMLLADRDHASLVYEDRGSGQFHEFRIPRTNKLEREVLRLLKSPRQIKVLNRTFGSLFVAAGGLLALFKRA